MYRYITLHGQHICWVVTLACSSYWEQQSSGSACHKGIVGVNMTICWAPTSLWNVLPSSHYFVPVQLRKSVFIFRWNGRVHLFPRGMTIHWAVGSRCVRVSCGTAGEPLFHTHMAVIGHQLHSPLSPWLSLHYAESCHHIIIRLDLAECGKVSFLKLWMILFQSFVHQRGTQLQMKRLTWWMICRSWHHPESGCSSNLLLTPGHLLYMYQSFGNTCWFHLRGRRVSSKLWDFRFSHQYSWGFLSSGMWGYVIGWGLTDFSKNCTASMDLLTLEDGSTTVLLQHQ